MDATQAEVSVPWWATVLVAAGTGLAVIVTAFSKGVQRLIDTFFKHWSDRLLRKRYAHGLREVVQVALVLDQMERIPSVDRVLWFVGRNGGGLPKPGSKYTVRAEHGWTSKEGLDPVKRYNFDLTVDPHYTKLLADMIETGRVMNTTADMPDSAILTAYYRDEGVVQSVLYFLTLRENELHYLSIATYSAPFTTDQLARVEMLVQRLRSLMDS